jgi:hypothetical protein
MLRAMRVIVDYNWDDEEAFSEQFAEEEGEDTDIFTFLKVVDAYLGEAGY